MMDDCGVQLVMEDSRWGILAAREEIWSRYAFAILADGENGEEQVVGHMVASKLSVGELYRQRLSLWMAFDDYSDAAANCYSVVFTAKGAVRKAFWDVQFGQEEMLLNDFHHLERIEIDEKYKGRGLAGIATQIYLENFANGNDVAYLKAYPLQYEPREEPYGRAFEGALQKCQAKLCGYYERLGFRKIGKGPHFFFVVDQFLERRKKMSEQEEAWP